MGTYGLLLVIVFLIATSHVTFSSITTNNICTSDKCINTASEILANLNRTVDPCNNFYKFACGGWLQHNRPNDTFPYITILDLITQKIKDQLRELVEKPAKENDGMALRKAKHIYTQCMTNEDNNTDGNSNLRAIIHRYAEWPLVMPHREWDDTNLTWQNISMILHENGFNNGLYDITVGAPNKTSNSKIIIINEPTFCFPRDAIIHPTKTRAWNEIHASHIVSIVKKFIEENNGTVEIDNLTQDALDIVQFETELTNLTTRYEEYNKMFVYIPLTIQQWQEEFDKQHPEGKGKINWHLTIQTLFASEEIAIEPSEKLVVEAHTYLFKLISLLERTPSRTIVNYMLWTVICEIRNYIIQLKKNIRDMRWKTCISKSNLKFAILHEYVKKYVSDESIKNIREITTDIKNVIREQIKNSTWMDEPTKKACLDKITYMKQNNIKPDWYNNKVIDNYYKNINVSTTYDDTLINLFTFEKKKMLSLLRIFANETFSKVDTKFAEPNAYYIPSLNQFVVPSTILQDPIYNRTRLPFINYASLGFIIAHEINHAFDKIGSKYDKDGNVVQLWSPKVIDEYIKITQCFIDQYNEYLFAGLEHMNVSMNGHKTLNENIADSAGVVAAYYAYRNRKAKLNESESRLQGLEQYNDDQIFFITYAQTMCENFLPKEQYHIFDVHSVNEIRVRGSLSNFPEFSAAYNCSVGTIMNPIKKCVLWY